MSFNEPDTSKLIRWAVAVKGSAEKASQSWASFRRKPQVPDLVAFVDEVKNICTFTLMIAKVTGMDQAPFRSAESDMEAFQLKVMGRGFAASSYSPSALGKVTSSMSGLRAAAKELVVDARGMSDAVGYDYMVFGTDLGIVIGSLVPIAKALKVDTKGLIRARNAIMVYFKVVIGEILAQVPEGGTVTEVPATSMVFAAWSKRASMEVRRNPVRAAAMLDGLLRAVEIQ